MRRMRLLLGWSISLVACSPELHLGDPGNEPRETTVLSDAPPEVVAKKATDRAVSIVEESRPILTFGIDNGELYWIVITAERELEVDWQLYRCSLENCAATVESLGASTLRRTNVEGTTLTMAFDGNSAYFYGDDDSVLPVRCDKNGWKGAAAQPVLDLTGHSILLQGQLYWWGGSSLVWQCLALDCAATKTEHYLPAVADSKATDWSARWLEADSEYLYTWWGGSIQRYATGRMQPFDVFLEHDETVSDIASVGDQLYWTESGSYGAIKRCPKSGCEGEPSIVVDGLNHPIALQVDGSRAYVAERDNHMSLLPRTGSVTRHSLDGTEEPWMIVQDRDNVGQIQLHGPLVYLLSCAVMATPNSFPYVAPRSCSISAVAR